MRKQNENSLKNLKPFEKGDDPRRNAGGQPLYVKELKQIISEKSNNGERLEKVVEVLFDLAEGGDIRSIAEILDRAYVKAKQIVETKTIDPFDIEEV